MTEILICFFCLLVGALLGALAMSLQNEDDIKKAQAEKELAAGRLETERFVSETQRRVLFSINEDLRAEKHLRALAVDARRKVERKNIQLEALVARLTPKRDQDGRFTKSPTKL